MGEEKEIAPPTTPYGGCKVDDKLKQIIEKEREIELKSLGPEALRNELNEKILRSYNREKNIFEIGGYKSPSGDIAFENQVNTIMTEEYNKIINDPSIAEQLRTDERFRSSNLSEVKESFRSITEGTDSGARDVTQGADPVNLYNGNFVYSTTDFSISGAGIDFSFNRIHSNQVSYRGPLGEK